MSKFTKKLKHSIQKRFHKAMAKRDLEVASHSYLRELEVLLGFGGRSQSQYHQDLFVLSELGFKKGGFFVEFGATNGFELSNSFLLEKSFGWNGILAEPARVWHTDLAKNRTCNIEKDCVWSKTGEVLKFNEVEASNISTIDLYSKVEDGHEKARRKSKVYDVQTISLVDLLRKYNAPAQIDYLSIDTEGSEYEILQAFDFTQYQFSVITCEHNHMPVRDEIYKLLTANGYKRKLESLSMCDDWYVRA